MSATTEKLGSRAALLAANLERCSAARGVLEQRIAELPALEEEARLQALAQRPTQRSGALGSQAQKLRDERLKKRQPNLTDSTRRSVS